MKDYHLVRRTLPDKTQFLGVRLFKKGYAHSDEIVRLDKFLTSECCCYMSDGSEKYVVNKELTYSDIALMTSILNSIATERIDKCKNKSCKHVLKVHKEFKCFIDDIGNIYKFIDLKLQELNKKQ